ncbi:hypothetical protein H6F88_01615 [Oculatella sp. FACHB-28]|uniref:hypothetical protein n=1 Tax=Oculatella sp. FACHB-28 TaxID=2692845 RepID=UPI0016839F22|nr:hypothetical protein [Oculatella sp. FACHB-28]MBD2054735.1 hypothetical protein [Oculatella sp. FACHB-28]
MTQDSTASLHHCPYFSTHRRSPGGEGSYDARISPKPDYEVLPRMTIFVMAIARETTAPQTKPPRTQGVVGQFAWTCLHRSSVRICNRQNRLSGDACQNIEALLKIDTHHPP